MAELPGRETAFNKLFGQAAVYDFVLAPLAIVGTSIASYEYLWKRQYGRMSLTALAAGGVLIAGICKAVYAYHTHKTSRNTYELDSCLHMIHSALLDGRPPDPTRQLRITIFRPVDDDQRLEQIMDYVGISRSRKTHKLNVGRKFPAQSGIIGRAFRMKEPVIASRTNSDVEAYVQELMSEWTYTERDARACNMSVYSWMAVPLVEVTDGRSSVQGIVFMDCTAASFFDKQSEQDTKTEQVAGMCNAIAQFVAQRYT